MCLLCAITRKKLAYSGVQRILCCVFVLSSFVLCIPCCQFLWIVHCWLPLRYSLTFIVYFIPIKFLFWRIVVCCWFLFVGNRYGFCKGRVWYNRNITFTSLTVSQTNYILPHRLLVRRRMMAIQHYFTLYLHVQCTYTCSSFN
jgi:hypothetical protein